MANKSNSPDISEKKQKNKIRRKWHWGTFGHVVTVFMTLVVALVALVVMVLGQFFVGPSQTASDMVTQLFHQSSALKFIPYLYLYDGVSEALERGEVVSANEVTDTSLVTVKARTEKNYGDEAEDAEEEWDENGIRLETVTGATFKGYMMIVRDPSRVSLGVCSDHFSTESNGKRVDEIMEAYGAIAGMNGGAFYDSNGSGTGGEAEGLVISQGKKMKNQSKAYPVSAGFDANDILHVGSFTAAEAVEMGIRDACAFGPALIVNGVASVSNDKGLNPRSAIGQRADGAVLLLVIDGRQSNSLGATINDVINVMLDYGAVNACNMDGGSSSIMYYGDEKINDGMTVSVSRRMPTAWIVK